MFTLSRYKTLFVLLLFISIKMTAQLEMTDSVGIGTLKHYYVDPNPVPGSTYIWRIDGIVQSATSGNEINITWNSAGIHELDVQELSATGCLGPLRSGQVKVISLPSGWTINPSGYAFQGQVTAKVFINFTPVESGFLAAFVGEECRGIAAPTYFSPSSNWVFNLMIYSNNPTGESLTFRYYDPVLSKTFKLNRVIAFTADMISGNASNPIEMYNTVDYNRTLTAGWNWFSLNTLVDNMTLGSVLAGVNTNGDYIKDQISSATYYDGFGWFGTFTEMDPTKLYKIKVQNSSSISYSGIPANVNMTPIGLVAGWNWAGYLPQTSQTITDALSSLSLTNGDYIKSQTESTTYYSGFGWFGTLTQLFPREGYMIKLANPATLKYTDGLLKKEISLSDGPAKTLFDPTLYEFNGSVTASVMIDGKSTGSKNDTLYAFVDNQLRGLTPGFYFAPQGIYLFPIMIFSNKNEGEKIEFKYYSASDSKLYTCKENLIFVNNMIIADAFHPFIINTGSFVTGNTNVITGSKLKLKAYPNPYGNLLNIEYTVPETDHVILSVYNSNGMLVQRLIDEWQIPGFYSIRWDASSRPFGMYFIKIQTGLFQEYQKVVKIR